MAILSYGQVGWRSAVAAPVSGVDTDAQAFITAASITDSTQQSAINTLVTQLKTYGIWTKMKALYPFVGGIAESHRFNLKNTAQYKIDFMGGGNHTSNGYIPNGTTAYANTNIIPSITHTPNNLSIGLYTNTNRTASNRIAYGVTSNTSTYIPLLQLYLKTSSNQLISDLGDFNYGRIITSNTDSSGFYVNNRPSSNSMKVFRNGNLLGSSSDNNTTNTLPGNPLTIACFNGNATYSGFETINYQFFYTSDGLTDTEAANFYTAVQAYQTTLGRAV